MTETNQIIGKKFHLGEKEFTNIMWTMIRAYRFHNRNEDPEAIVIPKIGDVNGVRIEYPKEEPTIRTDAKPKSGTGKAGDGDSGDNSKA